MDNAGFVPSHDTNIFDWRNATLAHFTTNDAPNSLSQQQNTPYGLEPFMDPIIPQGNLPFADPIIQQGNVPFMDPMVQDHFMHNNGGTGNFLEGPSLHDPENETLEFNEVLPLSHWPQSPAPFFCSCCHVLREIIHTNGTNFQKLEIHGTLGLITHAIHRQNITVAGPNNVQYEMIDFCYRNPDEIRTFLINYCAQQASSGYVIMQDPLSTYYEALCTGLDWTEDLSDECIDLNPNNSANEMEQEAENGTGTKISLASQRERAGRMELSDFSDYFHLPIEEASRQVSLCPTVVKKICRRAKLKRWPYRKVKSITKQIGLLRRALGSEDAVSRVRTQEEINRLVQQMIRHCGGVLPTAIDINRL
ncbi:uncharacterized protein LOC113866238 [Abrus precatorius]|uniref:Uncharacterized protein LOC113866238 n=1 Tax=Abrus precatorius TaxID=3816 RepID=A0A8B8LKY1_ABRPR|nr:uncharacterized protein LOC113866238 [Abrus precatorius]